MMKIVAKCIGVLMLCVSGFTFADQGKFELFQFERHNGAQQPYVLYTPAHLDRNQAHPLIVYLHGAVSIPTSQRDPLDAAKRSPMVKLADEGGYYVLFPYGQQGITWFDNVGVEMVLAEIEAVKQKVQINPNKIFLSGFSDGGSGAFYIAATQGESFAGFMSLNGAMPVATNLGESPVYLSNINQKPFYIVNTQSDMLYPARLMTPLIEYWRQYHTNLTVSMPEGQHDMGYFPTLMPALKQFIEQHQRQTPEEFMFETADNTTNRYAWLTITELATDQVAKAWHQPYQLEMINDKASLGVGFDRQHQAEGLKITSVKKGSIADSMGIQAGDVIVKVEDQVLNGRRTLSRYLASKKAGDSTYFTIQRGSETLQREGRFPPPYAYEVFVKQPISGKVKVKKQGKQWHIDTSRIAAFEIDFEQFPKTTQTEKVSLVINGQPREVSPVRRQTFVLP